MTKCTTRNLHIPIALSALACLCWFTLACGGDEPEASDAPRLRSHYRSSPWPKPPSPLQRLNRRPLRSQHPRRFRPAQRQIQRPRPRQGTPAATDTEPLAPLAMEDPQRLPGGSFGCRATVRLHGDPSRTAGGGAAISGVRRCGRKFRAVELPGARHRFTAVSDPGANRHGTAQPGLIRLPETQLRGHGPARDHGGSTGGRRTRQPRRIRSGRIHGVFCRLTVMLERGRIPGCRTGNGHGAGRVRKLPSAYWKGWAARMP